MSVSIIFNNYILFFDDNCVQNAQNADAAKPWKIYPKDVTFLVLEKKGKRMVLLLLFSQEYVIY